MMILEELANFMVPHAFYMTSLAGTVQITSNLTLARA